MSILCVVISCLFLHFPSQTLLILLDLSTPPLLSHHLTLQTHSFLTLHSSSLSSFLQNPYSFPNLIAIIDATFSFSQSDMIESMCEDLEVPVLMLSYGRNRPKSMWGYYVRGTYEGLVTGIEGVMRRFEWTKGSFVGDDKEETGYLYGELSRDETVSYTPLFVTLTSQQAIDTLIGRSLRLTGNRITIIATSPDLTKQILKAQYRKQIGGTGYANILLPEASLYDGEGEEGTLRTGNLVVMEKGMEGVGSLEEYYVKVVEDVMGVFKDYIDQTSLLASLNRLYPSHIRPSDFSLLNLQSGLRIPIGSISSSILSISHPPVYFLGNTTSVPTNTPSILPLSGNFGVRNAHSYHTSVLTYYCGTLLAVEDINRRRDVLETHIVEVFNFTAGVQVWDYDFAYENVNGVTGKLGLAVFTSSSSALTMKLYPFLRSLNYTGPLVGASNTVNTLSSTSLFPGYVRTVVPDKASVVVYVQMFKRYGWTKCGIFVSDEAWGLGIREAFVENANKTGISILNSPEYQVLPTPIPSVSLLRDNYTAHFQDFISTQSRILILALNNNAVYVVDYLYELGLRQGEVQILAFEFLNPTFISSTDPTTSSNRREILSGAVQFSPISYVGEFGLGVKQRLEEKYVANPPLYACFYYDAGLAVGYALDEMMKLGEDYMDPEGLLRTIKAEKFVGCSGVVTFSLTTNDRTEMSYGIFNAYPNASSDLQVTQIGVYNPTSVEMFSFDREIVWCDGTANAPTDSREMVSGCPFEKREDNDFPAGQTLLYRLFPSYFLYISLLSLLFSFCLWKTPIPELTERQQFELLDAVMYWNIALEMTQYIGLGPDVTYLPEFLRVVIAVTVLDLDHLPAYTSLQYETLIITLCSLCLFTLLLWVILLFRLDHYLARCPGCKLLGDIGELTIWLLSDWMFIPAVSVFGTLFVCIRCNGTPIDYFHSYLQTNCYISCWQGRHLVYISLISLLFLIYIPLLIALRPIWQHIFPHSNIKANSKYLMTKSGYQIALILLKIAGKRQFSTWFKVVFVILEGGFVLYSLKCRCFSYHRANLWVRLSLFGCLIPSVLGCFVDLTEPNVLLGLCLTGWGGLLIFGMLYQRFFLPSLLFGKEGIDAMHLFRFAFQRASESLLETLSLNFRHVEHRSVVVFPETDRSTAEDRTVSQISTAVPKSRVLPAPPSIEVD